MNEDKKDQNLIDENKPYEQLSRKLRVFIFLILISLSVLINCDNGIFSFCKKQIIKDFELSKFVVCTDAGLASNENRKFNSKNSDKELNENYSSFLTNKPEINKEKENNFISSNMTDTAKLINEEEREKEEMKYISQISQRFCLIKNKSIIGDHKNKKNQKNEKNEKKQYTADYIIETSKFFISSGTSNEIIIYTKDFSFETKFKILFTDWVYNILENKGRDDKKENYMIATQGKQIKLFKVIIDKKTSKINPKKEVNPLFSLKIGEDFLVCCQNKVVKYSSNLLQENLESKEEVLKDNFIAKGATKINNFVLLKSNKICSIGNDNLFLFNIVTKEIVTCNIKDEYSFVYSQNGLTILSINIKNKKDKKVIDKKKNILLCACKKYIKNQKNGILLLTGFEESTKYFDIKTYFFDTGKFEVYCFCPILIFDTNNIINKNNITNTNYFLVGGFEKLKNKGLIKLFKVIYCNEHFDYRIEFIQDIEIIDKYASNKFIFKKFKKPISCITQSSSNNNLLITCWDGNVYLLETLNIESYLKFDELSEKNISLNDLNAFHF